MSLCVTSVGETNQSLALPTSTVCNFLNFYISNFIEKSILHGLVTTTKNTMVFGYGLTQPVDVRNLLTGILESQMDTEVKIVANSTVDQVAQVDVGMISIVIAD